MTSATRSPGSARPPGPRACHAARRARAPDGGSRSSGPRPGSPPGSRKNAWTRLAPSAASCARTAGSAGSPPWSPPSGPIDCPHTRANTEPGGSSGATARGDLNVTSPGREYANRSSGRARATSSLSAGSRPGKQVANAKSATRHDSMFGVTRQLSRADRGILSAMYRLLYWLVLRRLPAEATHRVSFALMRAAVALPGVARLIRRLLAPRASELRVHALGRELPGPLGLAAGFD